MQAIEINNKQGRGLSLRTLSWGLAIVAHRSCKESVWMITIL